MLTAIGVGNFKAFAETQRIPLRPLTLIYGANSSGKSSVIHSLILACHALETGELDVHRTNIGGESVDLGGFRQFIHRRDVSNRMEWSAELNTASFTGRLAEILAPVKRVAISLTFGIALDNQGYPLSDAQPEVHTYELLGDDTSLLRMSIRRDGNFRLDQLNQEHPVIRKIMEAVVLFSTTTETLHSSDFEGLDEAISELIPGITVISGKFLPEGIDKVRTIGDGSESLLIPVSPGRRNEILAEALQAFFPRTLDDLIRGISSAVAGELTRFQYLGPLRSYPPRHLVFSQYQDPNWFAGGGHAWDIIRRDPRVRGLVNDWLSASDRLQTPYEIVLRDLIGIDQLDEPLLEGLEKINEDGLDIEPDIDRDHFAAPLPVIKDPEKEALKLQELIRASDIEKLNEIIMIDRRSNTIVSHRDIGIGVSQVLPVLVTAYASKNQIIAIEQPEIHLHPALQADLGDVFIKSALGEGKNRFLIESHSEHLLLRIMRRMRETDNGDLPDGVPPVTTEDVCVLFVQPRGPSLPSAVRHLELDEEGQFLDPWPGGFFEEGYRERFA